MARYQPPEILAPVGSIALSGATLPDANRQSKASAVAIIGWVYLFFLFSHTIEFIDTKGLHLIALLGAVATCAAIAGGKMPEAFKAKPGMALSLFTGFLIFSMPFSSWKGGSVGAFMDLWWKSYLTYFLVSSLIFTLPQLRRSLFVIAVASAGILYVALKSAHEYVDGRMSGEYGSLGNSNDLAGALLMCLPFAMYVVLDKNRAAIVRLAFLGTVGMLLVTVTKTGSRASILVLVLMAIVLFFKAKAADKAKLALLVAVAVCAFPFVVSKEVMARYATIFQSQVKGGMSDNEASAVMSTNARTTLQKNAVALTIHHPIFGVGLGNFAFQSANIQIARGETPMWYTCHNIFLLVSSETGVIGWIFYVATLVFTTRILVKVQKAAKVSPELKDAAQMAFCTFMGLLAFAACGFFGTNAYGMQMPAMAGLAVALERLTKPLLLKAEESRLSQFRQEIPVKPSKFAGAAQSALSYR